MGCEQLPQPAAQVDVHSPFEHATAAVWELEHARVQPPQSAVVVPVFVSQPPEGSLVQCPKPEAHVSEQSLLHVPSIGLQHVVPPQTTDPAFCAYEHVDPSVAQLPVGG
jgi:hypothetical protein